MAPSYTRMYPRLTGSFLMWEIIRTVQTVNLDDRLLKMFLVIKISTFICIELIESEMLNTNKHNRIATRKSRNGIEFVFTTHFLIFN